MEPHAQGRGGDRHHCPGQEAEHHAIGQVVECHQLAAADLLQLEVERESRPRGDGGAHEDPTRHGQEIAHEQADDNIVRADAGGDEQRPDHQLGSGRMFAGVHADEAAEAQ